MGAERGHLHARLGWGGRRPGARLPLLARGSGGGGGGLSQAGPGRGEHSFSHGLYGEPREPPLGSERGGRTTPRLWAHIASSRGRPCPPGRLPAWISTWCQERAGAQAGKGVGLEGRSLGSWGRGASPRVYTPSSLGAGPPDSLGELRPSRGRVLGRGPPRKGGGGGRAPAELCAGCFVGAGGLGSVPGGPGRGRGGSAAASSLPVRCGQSPVRVFLSARLLVHSSAEILPRALRGLGLLLGPAGVPGLEERRAEWLTTL